MDKSEHNKNLLLKNAKKHVILYNYREAINDCNRVLEIDSECVEAHNIKGSSFECLANYKYALLCFNRSLELDSENTEALNCKGFLRLRYNIYNEAIELFDKVLKKNPNNRRAMRGKVQALEQLNELI